MSADSAGTHRCDRPDDAEGPGWTGRRDLYDHPLWGCPTCHRWWSFAWPGFGGHVEEMTWMPMRDVFTGKDPDTFKDIIEAERALEQE
jgi:hypothetical protein